MKKLILLASVSLFAFTSCKKDDDEETNSIGGDWKLNKTEIKYGNGSSESETPNTCEAQTTFSFKNDNKVTSKVYYNDGTRCISDTYTGNYSYDSDSKILTLTESGETDTYSVTTLTSSEFVLLSDSDDYDGDGKVDREYLHFKK
ncbi:lipocalin family protein [Epilithonimonas xixisoli]|uniref:Lipocalin-like protein n=1 Tax=Epilithonimonas xixisoli TaxID=1476462 RepID=A0A4R8IFA5_9FLAO|nr:lipocalin family protein [Epilithonimonas xixisoli]TDX87196.1 lipocalin-like protein [Epilithonimonas xixisoli]